MILFANNAFSTLAGAISNVSTSASLQAGTGALFPSPGSGDYFVMTFTDAATGLNNEIVHVTARSGDAVTIVRAQEGTSAKNWSAGDHADNLWTAGQASVLQASASVGGLHQSNYAVDSGSADAGIASFPVATSSMSDFTGMSLYVLKIPTANSGNYTLNVGYGAFPVRHTDFSSLTAGDLPANGIFEVVYDGASGFQLLSVNKSTVSPAQLYATQNQALLWSQQQPGNFAADIGSGNQLIVNYSPAPPSYAYMTGSVIRVKKTHSWNTGASTININGLGDLPIARSDGGPVQASDLAPDMLMEFGLDAGGRAVLFTPTTRILGPAPAGVGTGIWSLNITDIGRTFITNFIGQGITGFVLPDVATVGAGWWVRVRCIASALGDFGTITGVGGQTIDGGGHRYYGQDTDVYIVCDGGNWQTLSGSYVMWSPEYTPGLGTQIGFSHGINPMRGALGVMAMVYWRCVSGDLGYSVGDVVQDKITNVNQVSSANITGLSHDADGNWTRVQISTVSLGLLNKTTGIAANMNLGSWRLIMRIESK